MNGLEQLFTQGIPTVTMASVFIYYLIRKDGVNTKTFGDFNDSLQEFNRTLRNHLASQIKAQSASTKAQIEMSKAFQQLSDLIGSLNRKSKHK